MNGTVKYSVGILAGGNSTRMGRNKALLEFESKTFLTRIIEEFKDHEIIISGSYDGEYNIPGIKEVSDENKDYGPVEGIRQILNNSSEEYVFICACDMPFIKENLDRVMRTHQGYQIYITQGFVCKNAYGILYARSIRRRYFPL